MSDDSTSRITVRVKPRARRDEVRRGADGTLEVRVTAPPADGAANERVLRVLGKYLGVPPSSLRIVGGHKARVKRVAVPAGVNVARAFPDHNGA